MKIINSEIKVFESLAKWATRLVVLLVVTGGTVRLTESGLGCKDWPNCTTHSFTAPLKFHPLVEDINRFVVFLVTIFLVSLFVYSYRTRRKDLKFLSFLLVMGVFLQAIVGAIVVYSHLFPPFVMIHFLLSIAMVANGVILHHRAKYGSGRRFDEIGNKLPKGKLPREKDLSKRDLNERNWILGILFLTLMTVTLGTFATASGPHAGATNAKRLPLPFWLATSIHAISAVLLICAIVFFLFKSKQKDGNILTVRWTEFLLEAVGLQATIGIVQFELHVPSLLVGFHLFGACVVSSIAVKLLLMFREEKFCEFKDETIEESVERVDC